MAYKGRSLTVYQFGSGSRSAGLRAQRKLADQRRVEERSLYHESSLNSIRTQICRSEFEEITNKRSSFRRSKYEQEEAQRRTDWDLERKRNELRALLQTEAEQLKRELADKERVERENEMTKLRQAGAEARKLTESQRQELLREKRLQQYRERCEDARVMASRSACREVSEAQKLQIAAREEEEHKRLAEENAWAQQQRTLYDREQLQEAEISTKKREEQRRYIAETLWAQTESRREAERTQKTARRDEELLEARRTMEEHRALRLNAVAERREQRSRVATELQMQITERYLASQRAKAAEAEEARRARAAAAEAEARATEHAALSVRAARREEEVARVSVGSSRRAREEHDIALDRLVDAERRRLEAIRIREQEQREEARRKLAREVEETRRQQLADRECEEMATKTAREREARDIRARAEEHRLLEVEERRAKAAACQQYRDELRGQMLLARQMKEEEKQRDERRYREQVASEEQFRRGAIEALTAPTRGVMHPFAAPPTLPSA